MPRPITAIIHQQALAHNLSVARQCMPNSQVFAVVKANAYGHGIERVYAGLEGADGFAFLDIEEGTRLRALGCKKPLMLLEGIFAFEDLFECAKHEMSFAIHSRHQVQWLKQFAEIAPDAQFDVYLKMNSGMNRLGFEPQQYAEIWQELHQLNTVRSITHMTHFSDADGQRFGVDGIQHQNLIFSQTIQGLEGKISLSNSAAILRHHQTLHSDIVRSGIMLYGSSPDYPTHTIQDWNLQPSMSLRSEIIAIQMIQTGREHWLWFQIYCHAGYADRDCGLWLCRWLSTSIGDRYARAGRFNENTDIRSGQYGYAGRRSDCTAAGECGE